MIVSELPSELVEITDRRLVPQGASGRVFTSLEGENPSGSIKDHMVARELEELLARGVLRPGALVSEVSAGNTARSLAHHCKRHGLRSALFVPNFLPESEIASLRAFADEVHVGDPAGGLGPYLQFCAERGSHPFNQFTDEAKARHYRPLGQAARTRHAIDRVVGAVGTGHSLRGLAEGAGVPSVTAEPTTAQVPGVRNLDRMRMGPSDPCVAEWFGARQILDEADWFPEERFETSVGLVHAGPSFRIVLGAVRRLLTDAPALRLFAVGAVARRVQA